MCDDMRCMIARGPDRPQRDSRRGNGTAPSLIPRPSNFNLRASHMRGAWITVMNFFILADFNPRPRGATIFALF